MTNRIGRLDPVALGSQPGTENQDEVVCLSCNKNTTPGVDWKCQHCRTSCLYGWGSAPCWSCGVTRPAQRKGHRFRKPVCDCDLPEAERARRRGEEAKNLAKEQAELARLRGIEEAKVKKGVDREAATACFERKNRSCNVVISSPRLQFCHACPKFGNARPAPEARTASPTADRGYRPPLRDVPMQDIPLPDTG